MQIIPNGAGWTNPAALNQQALSDAKHIGSSKNEVSPTEPVNPLEQSGKASDRDANERYDGPQQSGAKSNPPADGPVAEAESMLSFPANDNLAANTLDLLG